jgi:hypothetical protein
LRPASKNVPIACMRAVAAGHALIERGPSRVTSESTENTASPVHSAGLLE